jgi:hypothetical protein
MGCVCVGEFQKFSLKIKKATAELRSFLIFLVSSENKVKEVKKLAWAIA